MCGGTRDAKLGQAGIAGEARVELLVGASGQAPRSSGWDGPLPGQLQVWGWRACPPSDTELNPYADGNIPTQMGYAVRGGSSRCWRGLSGAALSAQPAWQRPE